MPEWIPAYEQRGSGSDHGKFLEVFWFREIQAKKKALAAILEANSGMQFVPVLMRVLGSRCFSGSKNASNTP
jgi:hypothetical protein